MMKYAGFWKRFVALWVDFFVLILPGLVFGMLESYSRTSALLTLIPSSLLGFAYEIYFHGRWGQTIGKMSMRIRVVCLDGALISWKQAFLRSSVGLGLAVLLLISNMVALLKISESEFSNLSWREINQLAPYVRQINFATTVWEWSEVIVMLFNRKRRALHDFIAGTVVIDASYQPSEQQPVDSDAI